MNYFREASFTSGETWKAILALLHSLVLPLVKLNDFNKYPSKVAFSFASIRITAHSL